MLLEKQRIQLAFATGIWKIDSTMELPIAVGSNSLDVHLDGMIITDGIYQRIDDDKGYMLEPGEFILGVTCESVDCSKPISRFGEKIYFTQQIEGTSTLARLGIMVHITASYASYGFNNAFTLEIVNLSKKPFKLMRGMHIGQIYFKSLLTQPYESYKGKYIKPNRKFGCNVPIPVSQEKIDSLYDIPKPTKNRSDLAIEKSIFNDIDSQKNLGKYCLEIIGDSGKRYAKRVPVEHVEQNFDEDRIDIIGQNGNDGDHYE